MKTNTISKWVAAMMLLGASETFAQVGFNIGTLQPGEKITITFDATINTPLPANTSAVTNQATLTATGVSLSSDDPTTALINDPTITTLSVAPVITSCPGSITTNNATGTCGQTVAFAATATGGDSSPVITYKLGAANITSPFNFPVGTNLVTVTASNGVLPNATCSFTVVVLDTQLPTVFCPADITTNSLGTCPVVVNFSASATDNCGLSNLVVTPGTGSSFPLGTNIVNLVAWDLSNNTNTCSFKVIVLPGTNRPSLNIVKAGPNAVLSWTNLFSCYNLQFATTLTGANNWSNYAGTYTTVGNNIYVTNPIGSNLFFRLKY